MPSGQGFVLTHGAGGSYNSKLLVALAEHLARAGYHVLRYNLPFRRQRAYGPPPRNSATDRKGLSDAVSELKRVAPAKVFLAGHSYGGRQASILAVEEPDICDGLLLLSYPLHPPKQPHSLRTGHFGSIRVRAFFAHGTKDPFGGPAELKEAAQLIPAATRVSIVPGAGHELNKGSFDLQELIVTPFQELMERPT